jgi:hypothetical protein
MGGLKFLVEKALILDRLKPRFIDRSPIDPEAT